MTPSDAFNAGYIFFLSGAPRDACPFPAPFDPPRNDADVEADLNGVGANFLAGWDAAQSAALRTRWAS